MTTRPSRRHALLRTPARPACSSLHLFFVFDFCFFYFTNADFSKIAAPAQRSKLGSNLFRYSISRNYFRKFKRCTRRCLIATVGTVDPAAQARPSACYMDTFLGPLPRFLGPLPSRGKRPKRCPWRRHFPPHPGKKRTASVGHTPCYGSAPKRPPPAGERFHAREDAQRDASHRREAPLWNRPA